MSESGSGSGSGNTTIGVSIGSAPTLARAAPPLPPEAPPAGGERYRIEAELGRGGMGVVYRALDVVLGRRVALKILRVHEPSSAARFLQEARAQARVDHENVCRVYEAGELDGGPFIAMQWVDGPTLKDATASLPVDDRVRLMRQVAAGVQAAHRMGLVHRDLKPANVLVEVTDEGRLKPYVVDFGLARALDTPGLTLTGQAVGTPAYMAPEQATGDGSALDRRTDVYGLGATLYEVLTGSPPFTGANAYETMMKVLDEDPVPPRRRAPSLHEDLETIVLRCLEKEPARRYATVRALIEDLDRYLDGEPIAARPAGTLSRLARRVRRNRPLVALLLASSIVVLALLLVTLRVRFTAMETARSAQLFGEEVREIEALLRYASLLPKHDVRKERAEVIGRMAALEAEMKRRGPAAEGPGLYALGRGALALGDVATARRRLEAAWSGGLRTRETAFALGVAYAETYRIERELADTIRNPDLREARRLELDRLYRKPAVERLRESRGASAGGEYGEGLLARVEERWDDALALAGRAIERVPWLYEAELLRGDVEAARGRQAAAAGRLDEADRRFDSAALRYEAAAAKGQSDPRGHEGVCRVATDRMLVALYQAHGDVMATLPAVESACGRALEVDPDRAEGHLLLASAYRMAGERLTSLGSGDPIPFFSKSREAARRALAVPGAAARAEEQLGNAAARQAMAAVVRSADPMPLYAEAIRAFRASIAADPRRATTRNGLGLVLVSQAMRENATGKDPRPALREAVTAFQGALDLDPSLWYVLNNQGLLWTEMGDWERYHGMDGIPTLKRAESYFEEALRRNPRYSLAHLNLGYARLAQAQALVFRGRDASETVARGRAAIESGVAAAPGEPFGLAKLGFSYLVEALDLQSRGLSAAEAAGKALEAYGRARVAGPKNRTPLVGIANAHAYLAVDAMRRGVDPGPEFRLSIATYGDLRALAPLDVSELHDLAFIHDLRVRWEHANGRPVDTALREARAVVEKALALEPKGLRGLVTSVDLDLVAADALLRSGRDPSLPLGRARETLETARSVDPGEPDVHAADAQVRCLAARDARRRGRPFRDEIAAGLASVERALAVNPSHASALAAEGELRALAAEALSGPERLAERGRARAAFEKAFRLDPFLARENAGTWQALED